MTLLHAFQWLENTELGLAFLESRYLYPLVQAGHLLGLALSVGLIVVTDLRLIGAFQKRVPVADILESLRPWLLAGFALTFITGGLLFWPVAATLYMSTIFRLKFLLIMLAGINALVFEWRLGRKVETWGAAAMPPLGVRVAGWTSLGLWVTALIFGRLIAYYPGIL